MTRLAFLAGILVGRWLRPAYWRRANGLADSHRNTSGASEPRGHGRAAPILADDPYLRDLAAILERERW